MNRCQGLTGEPDGGLRRFFLVLTSRSPLPIMTFYAALALAAILLERLGFFNAFRSEQENVSFYAYLLAEGEEAEWHTRMRRVARSRPDRGVSLSLRC